MVVLCNAMEITVEEKLPPFEMCLHGKDDRLGKRLKKNSFSPQTSTTVWHHGMVHAVLNTHLPFFDGPITMEE